MIQRKACETIPMHENIVSVVWDGMMYKGCMHMPFVRGYERVHIVGHVMCVFNVPLIVHIAHLQLCYSQMECLQSNSSTALYHDIMICTTYAWDGTRR